MLLRWPKSACNLCRISPCKEQKEKLTVFMVRQITPRCCSTAATTIQGVFHTVLSLLPHSQVCSLPHVQCHRLPPNFRAPLSQPQLWSAVYLWWVHQLSTQPYNPLCPSPMNNPTAQLSQPCNASLAYFPFNAGTTLYRGLHPISPSPTSSKSACQSYHCQSNS